MRKAIRTAGSNMIEGWYAWNSPRKNGELGTCPTGKYVQPEAMVNAAWVAEVYQNGWGVP